MQITIPYGRQDITKEDLDAVAAVLQSPHLTQGPAIARFEEAVARYCGTSHAVAMNSATSALHLACLALDLGPGDILWTTPNTFVASANCARYCGADVDFVDIDPRTYNMCVVSLAEKLASAERSGKLPKIVIPVDFAGQSCDMKGIYSLAQRYGFKIIEDASHAVGGSYLGLPVGSCTYSDITIFSFHPVKIITSAEGGMALTNDPILAARMGRLRSHGITRETTAMQGASEGDWYYQQLDLGYNYRITDIQAALGHSQLARLDQYVTKRHALAQRYDELLAPLPLVLPYQSPDAYSALHLYPVTIDPGRTDVNRKTVFDYLRANGVGVNVHYIPVHTHPYYKTLGFKSGDYPHAENYYAHTISIPLFPALTSNEQDKVISLLQDVLE